ncbi:MAG: hypothetical protein HC906_09690 [Bacteroidales bacterium]|nr:hypothetical protein [Bacteroidales bacterium]
MNSFGKNGFVLSSGKSIKTIMPQQTIWDIISAFPDEEVQVPTIPAGIYIQEAEELKNWAEEDKEVLTSYGLNPMLIEEIPVRADAYRVSQSNWKKIIKIKGDAEKKLCKKLPEAVSLHSLLVLC